MIDKYDLTVTLTGQIIEEFLYPIKPVIGTGRVLAIARQALFKLLQYGSLFAVEIDWRLQNHPAQQIASGAATHRGYTFATQSK
jgi:hypothetical protein